MSDKAPEPDFVMNPGEKTTMLFMQMVFQLSSLATMLLGKVPHPETGETRRDLESAQMVIDQLDMLEAKTRGNLNHDEAQLLKQTLMGLRMAYVEAVNQPVADKTTSESKAAPAAAPTGPEATAAPGNLEVPPADDASRKRFTKKY